MKKTLLALTLFIVSHYANCAEVWTGNIYIEQIISSNGRVVIYTTSNVDNCGNGNPGKFYWLNTDPDHENLMKLAMLAFDKGHTVRVIYQSVQADATCYSVNEHTNRMMITNIR